MTDNVTHVEEAWDVQIIWITADESRPKGGV